MKIPRNASMTRWFMKWNVSRGTGNLSAAEEGRVPSFTSTSSSASFFRAVQVKNEETVRAYAFSGTTIFSIYG